MRCGRPQFSQGRLDHQDQGATPTTIESPQQSGPHCCQTMCMQNIWQWHMCICHYGHGQHTNSRSMRQRRQPLYDKNPNILVNVRPCEPFTILLATTDGGHSHTNVCRSHGLLPLPLLDSMSYYQTCFVNPYASETFISPQAIVNSSAGSFNKWQLEGFLEGCPGILSMYSPSGLLKMSIQLLQQDGLFYSLTDTFTVNTNPRLNSSPFMGSAYTVPPPDVHLIDENNDNNDSKCSNVPNTNQPPTAPDKIDDEQPSPQREPPPPRKSVRQPTPQQPTMLSRSRVTVRLTNLARQLESELWAACLGHCGEDQLTSLATCANGLPNISNFTHFDTSIGKS
jgi:hypothetical protein